MFKRLFFTVLIFFAMIMPANAQLSESHESADSAEPVRLPIVMYHHVSPKQHLWGDYVISPEQLEADLKYFKANGYRSITLSELYAWYEGCGALPDKPFMITFDDGYESTGVYAEPLLAEYGFTAVVAVIGAVCQQYSDLPDHMLDYSHLSWEALREISDRGVFEIQCHTWDMHKISQRKGCNRISWEDTGSYKAALRGDLEKFLAVCEERDIDLCGGIAYPFGSWCDSTLDVVRELGFQSAFTCGEQVNILHGDAEELFYLGRYNRPHGVCSESFFAKWN